MICTCGRRLSYFGVVDGVTRSLCRSGRCRLRWIDTGMAAGFLTLASSDWQAAE